MSDLEQINRAIGRLEGKVDLVIAEQRSQGNRDDEIDSRLRDTQIAGAKNGMLSGGIISVAVEIIKQAFNASS